MSKKHTTPPFAARTIHRFSVLIILAWLAITAIIAVGVPPLEQVAKEHSVSVDPTDAPSFKAMKRMGEVFNEPNSNSVAMIVLEGQQRLGDDVHQYYDSLIRQLKDDPHVKHIHDFWGDPLTAAAAESADGKAVFVQVDLTGNLGETSANESAEAVEHIVDRAPPPPGVKTYITGTAPLAADLGKSGNSTVAKVTGVSMAMILIMLLLFFRSIITVILLLLMVGIELQVARGIVAFLGHNEVIGLTAYAVSLLVSLGIAAGTDYGIFFFGRYQEARQAGEDRVTAYYTTYHGVAKVVLASGLTIAGAVFCLSFTRLPAFQTLGIPCAVGMVVAVAVALTLVPATIAAGTSRQIRS
jgi:RND superfamily putative drug exporter